MTDFKEMKEIIKDDSSRLSLMPYLSEKGLRMEQELKSLADAYGYKKLPKDVSEAQRTHYMDELDDFWKNETFKTKEIKLTTHDGTVIATGVTNRGFVCGDYGVFLEIDPEQMNMDAVKVQPGQEYRINDPKYANYVKYHWYTDTTGDNIKLYFQQKGVTYADYQPGKWYISPYEVKVEIIKDKELTSYGPCEMSNDVKSDNRQRETGNRKEHFQNLVEEALQDDSLRFSLFGISEGIICQQVNCCGVMGVGLAKAILEEYPQVKEAFDDYYEETKNDKNRAYQCHFNQLGSYQLVPLDKPFRSIQQGGTKPDFINSSHLLVANIYSQDFYGNPEKTGKIYTKLDMLINSIQAIAAFTDLPVYIPHTKGMEGKKDYGIGCGYGGECWERVYPQLQELAEKQNNLYLLDTKTGEVTKVEPKLQELELDDMELE